MKNHMRRNIQWEHEKRDHKRGWYDCLLLLCGAFFCLLSAYRQMRELLDGMCDPVLPEHAWSYLLISATVLSVFYGSGVMRRMWHRLLSVLPVTALLLCYYFTHRIQLEDGILYLLRMYVDQICKYYDCVILFPVGVGEEAPKALLFWMMVLFIGVFVLAAAVQRMQLMLFLPLSLLVAALAVGRTPGVLSILLMLAGALVLRMYRALCSERVIVRAMQLAGVMGVCGFVALACFGLADNVTAKHDAVMARQLALENAVLALPVWELFTQNGMVTNDAPRTSGREMLTITLSDEPTENVYLKSYAANRYESGSWSVDEAAFANAAAAQGLGVEEAGEKIWNLSREDGDAILTPADDRTAIGDISMSLPKEYDYTISCRNFGKTSPLPYVSRLPEGLVMDGDTAAEKPWMKKNYGGSMVMSGSRLHGLPDYLANYYWTDLWTTQMELNPVSEMGDTESQENVWYSDLVWEQCTGESESAVVEVKLDEYLKMFGWESTDKIRSYFSSLQQEENVLMSNVLRLSYVPLVQALLQDMGSYSQKLDPLPAGVDPIDYFLGTSGEGYCVHFASAATLMLQTMGIPARYASGYVVFPKDFKKTADGYTAVVTDARSHAWVEVYLEGFGWIPYEVTPGFSDGETSEGQPSQTTNAADKNGQEHTDPAADGEEKEQISDDGKSDGQSSNVDTSGQKDGACGEWFAAEVFGRTVLSWIYVLIGCFAVYFAICLLTDGIRFCDRKQEESIRRAMKEGRYRAAILRINRRMYRMLSLRELVIGRRIRDDRCYERALGWFSAFREAAIDVELYMTLVRQAHFSEEEMRAADAEAVYKIYQHCRLTKGERIRFANTAVRQTEEW